MNIMNRLKIMPAYLLVVLFFLYLLNLIVYKTALIIFNISGTSFLIMGILAVLGLSFIFSLLLGIKFYNIFTRTYYLISMIWMGFLGYFFIASVLYILEISYLNGPSRFSALILFGVVIIIGTYGVFHAKKIYIKKINVKIPKLPSLWVGKKVVWISDLHIGQINGKKYVQEVVNKIKNISPDILFIGGDFFDGSISEEVLNCISPFRQLEIPLGIYFVAGNHESYQDSELFFDKIKEMGIIILDNEKKIIDNLQIIGVNFTDTAKENNFRKVLNDLKIEKEIPSILLKHEPKYIKVAEEAGVSFQISGHTHQAQQWPFKYIAYFTYGRFTYGLKKLKNMQVYTSSGVGTWGPPMRVGTNSEIVIFNFV